MDGWVDGDDDDRAALACLGQGAVEADGPGDGLCGKDGAGAGEERRQDLQPGADRGHGGTREVCLGQAGEV